MSLYVAWQDFCDQLNPHVVHFRNYSISKSITSATDFTIADECGLEGHLSRAWQAWHSFCRRCVQQSCMGSIDGNGVAVVGLPAAISDAHVSRSAMRSAKNQSPFWQGTNIVLRDEPNWGSTDVLSTILPRMLPSNQMQLSAAFSAGHQTVKLLQIIRNAAAHTNHQTLAEVRAFHSLYAGFPILHPVHALFWINPNTNDYLVTSALDELQDIALTAIS